MNSMGIMYGTFKGFFLSLNDKYFGKHYRTSIATNVIFFKNERLKIILATTLNEFWNRPLLQNIPIIYIEEI